VQIRVYYEDTDVGGIVYYANYLKFCERARSEVFFQKGINPFNENGHFVVKNLEASYHSSAKLGDILNITTQLIEQKKVSITLEQKVFKEDELLFSSTVKLAFLKDGKLTKIPQEFIEIFSA
jgi:acyl-CoA thioester hydrolase